MVVASVVRTKAVALEVGPIGVGVLGQLITFIALVATAAGVGLSNSGVKRVAQARADGPESARAAARGLLVAAHVLAVSGGLMVWIFRSQLDFLWPDLYPTVPWALACAGGVWAAVAAPSYVAALNGYERVRALAVVNAVGAVIGTAVTVGLLMRSDELGLVAALIAPSAATFGVAAFVVHMWPAGGMVRSSRLPLTLSWKLLRNGWHVYAPHLRNMLLVGGAFAASVFVTASVQFASRQLVEEARGYEVAGYFQATWSVSGLYLSFILSALAAEYYPRLSRLSRDPLAFSQAVDDQVRLASGLVAAVSAFAIAAAPVAVHVLYDAQFAPMTEMLRWQLSGDVFKVSSWAISYALLSLDRRGSFFLVETIWAVTYLGGLILVLSTGPLAALGQVYVGSYALYFLTLLGVGMKAQMLRRQTVLQVLGLTGGVAGVACVAGWSHVGGAIAALAVACAGALVTLNGIQGAKLTIHRLINRSTNT